MRLRRAANLRQHGDCQPRHRGSDSSDLPDPLAGAPWIGFDIASLQKVFTVRYWPAENGWEINVVELHVTRLFNGDPETGATTVIEELTGLDRAAFDVVLDPVDPPTG